MPVGKAMVIHEHGGIEKLTLVPEFQFPDEPKDGEVLVAVTAAGVNPVDVYVRSGAYPAKAFPLVRTSPELQCTLYLCAPSTSLTPAFAPFVTEDPGRRRRRHCRQGGPRQQGAMRS